GALPARSRRLHHRAVSAQKTGTAAPHLNHRRRRKGDAGSAGVSPVPARHRMLVAYMVPAPFTPKRPFLTRRTQASLHGILLNVGDHSGKVALIAHKAIEVVRLPEHPRPSKDA